MPNARTCCILSFIKFPESWHIVNKLDMLQVEIPGQSLLARCWFFSDWWHSLFCFPFIATFCQEMNTDALFESAVDPSALALIIIIILFLLSFHMRNQQDGWHTSSGRVCHHVCKWPQVWKHDLHISFLHLAKLHFLFLAFTSARSKNNMWYSDKNLIRLV